MKEYIDREALIKHLEEEAEECSDDPYLEPVSYGARLGINGALSFAKTLPAADVVEVKHGYWIENEDDFWVMCSECGTEFWDDQGSIVNTYRYCPYCGAKMDGERKEQK